MLGMCSGTCSSSNGATNEKVTLRIVIEVRACALQPTPAELNAEPRLHRFVIVFDREGATHSLQSRLWQQRIGALTYRKNAS
jgi:hypothetical protein